MWVTAGEAHDLDRFQLHVADVLQEPLAGAQEDRGDEQVQLVEEPGRPGTARPWRRRPRFDLLARRRRRGPAPARPVPAGDEVEGGALSMDTAPAGGGSARTPALDGRVVAPRALPVCGPSSRPGRGPNMLRPMMNAPTPATIVAAISSSVAVPLPNIHSCRRSPPVPSGSSRLWSGPAAKPSSETPIWQLTWLISPTCRSPAPWPQGSRPGCGPPPRPNRGTARGAAASR